MKKILNYLFEHKSLSRQQAREVLYDISKNVYSEAEVAAFITVYLMRSITIDELQGFRDALMELCLKTELDGHELMDIVGTGGDGKNTFNISTLSCFIVAGTGNQVAKHGNYGATSISGSSNVMEMLGYKFKNDADLLNKEMTLKEFEIQILQHYLDKYEKDVLLVAKKLDVGKSTLYRMIQNGELKMK